MPWAADKHDTSNSRHCMLSSIGQATARPPRNTVVHMGIGRARGSSTPVRGSRPLRVERTPGGAPLSWAPSSCPRGASRLWRRRRGGTSPPSRRAVPTFGRNRCRRRGVTRVTPPAPAVMQTPAPLQSRHASAVCRHLRQPCQTASGSHAQNSCNSNSQIGDRAMQLPASD